jgi:2-polyprenyl-6-methoxyphenol hydroxylase-like FAD-dependent oxidoreductase
VLIGDAFQTSCPAAGTGVSRLLVDVDRLCNEHVPAWLATPGMGADKIARFYADPAKRAADVKASRAAEYRRSLTVDTGLGWELHRRQVHLRRRTLGWVADRLRPFRRTAGGR